MLARKSLFIIASRSLSSVLLFISLMFMTRYLGPDLYGTITYTLAFVGLFNIFADFGFNAAHQKKLSEGKDYDDCLSTFILIKCILILFTVLATIVSVWFSSVFLGISIFDHNLIILYLFILYYVLSDIGTIATTTLNGQVKTAISETVTIVESFFRVPLVVMVCLEGMGAIELSIVYVVGAAAFCTAGVASLLKNGIKLTRPTLVRQYVNFAAPLAAVSVISIITTNFDKIFLGIFWDATTVGYYSGAQNILMFLLVIGTAVGLVLFPTISKLDSEMDTRSINDLIMMSEKYVTMLALPPILVLFLLPQDASILLLGSSFSLSAGPMRFLSLAVLFNIINIIYTNQLNAMNRSPVVLKVSAISIVLEMAVMLILVPESLFGVDLPGMAGTGVALAYLLMMFFIVYYTRKVCYDLTQRQHRLNSAYIISIIATTVAICALSMFVPLQSWAALLLYGIVSYAVYVTSLYITKGLNHSDLELMWTMVDPRRMKEYIENEFKER